MVSVLFVVLCNQVIVSQHHETPQPRKSILKRTNSLSTPTKKETSNKSSSDPTDQVAPTPYSTVTGAEGRCGMSFILKMMNRFIHHCNVFLQQIPASDWRFYPEIVKCFGWKVSFPFECYVIAHQPKSI